MEGRSFPIPAADGATIDHDNDLSSPGSGQGVRVHLAVFTRIRRFGGSAEGRFQCPKHKSKYSPDGIFSGRATRSMDRCGTQGWRERRGEPRCACQEDKQKSEWESAFASPNYRWPQARGGGWIAAGLPVEALVRFPVPVPGSRGQSP